MGGRGSLCVPVVALAALSTAHVIFAQLPVEFSGSRMGYIYDAQVQRIRPVLGIPGSAWIGNPLDTGLEMKDAVAIPGRNILLAFPRNTAPSLVSFETEPAEVRELEDVEHNPSKVIISPSGFSVALYYASTARILTVSGLPEKPEVTVTLDLSNSSGQLSHLAVDDEGRVVIAALSNEHGDVLFGWSRNDPPRLLTTASKTSSIVFLGSDAVVADSGAGEVFVLRHVEDTPSRRPLVSFAPDSPEIVITTLPERGEIYVGSAGSGIISVLDAEGQLLRTHDCNCPVSGFYPLNATVFRLTERLDRPIIILDAGTPSGRIAFIPALSPVSLSPESAESSTTRETTH